MQAVTQEVDPETFYAAGRQLFDLAGSIYDAFQLNAEALGATVSMAGSDDDGTAWAASYDERVGDLLGAANDLTVALENYGGVIIQAGYNHAVAEHNATPGAGAPPVKPEEPLSVAGALSAPPSAGGPGTGLVEMLGLLEKIGVPVPDGDTAKLDKAAQTWNQLATAQQVSRAGEVLEDNAKRFSDTKSPEIDIIAKDLRELRDSARAIVSGCTELSQSCTDYHGALDELRASLKGILEDLATELATTAAIAVAASFITFGAGAVAGTAKAAHTIKKFAGIVRTAVSSWKVSKNISKGVKRAHDISGMRRRLERIKNLGRKTGKPGPKTGPGVKSGPGKPLSTTRAQMEAKYKHAQDFGVTEPRGKAGFEAFEQAVKRQVEDPATMHINGTYRGNPAILNYNPNNGLVVVQSPAGEFISGWRVSPGQAGNILNQGKLGGG